MTITIPGADTDWMALSACRDEPDLWFSDASAARRLAIHICRTHCPVRDRCAADAHRLPCAHAVQAGVVYSKLGEPVEQQPKPSSMNCTTCGAARTAAHAVDFFARKPPTQWDDCGTYRAYRRHMRAEEQACGPCTVANRQYSRDRKTAARSVAA